MHGHCGGIAEKEAGTKLLYVSMIEKKAQVGSASLYNCKMATELSYLFGILHVVTSHDTAQHSTPHITLAQVISLACPLAHSALH